MAVPAQGRPPFRADHVGSLLRPPALRQAFRRRACGEGAAMRNSAQLQDQCIRDVVSVAGAGRPEGRDGRRIPPRLLLGAFCRGIEGFEIKPASFKFRERPGPRG